MPQTKTFKRSAYSTRFEKKALPPPKTYGRGRCRYCDKLFTKTKPNKKFCTEAHQKAYNNEGMALGPLRERLPKWIAKEVAKQLAAVMAELKHSAAGARIPGERATCPDCGARVTLEKSACACDGCRATSYLPQHNDSQGKPCFASGHGLRTPEPRPVTGGY